MATFFDLTASNACAILGRRQDQGKCGRLVPVSGYNRVNEDAMKTKILLLAVLAVILVSIGTKTISSRSQKEELAALELERADNRTHRWYVQAAKVSRQSRINLPVLICGDHAVPGTLDEAITQNGVVLAQAIDRKSVVLGNNGIETWYRFRIIENLSNKKLPECRDCGGRDYLNPKEMLPLDSDEILVPAGGGILNVDGVELVASYGNRGPYQFELSRRYVLFLKADASGQIGLVTMGPTGVFMVGDSDELEPNPEVQHPLQSEIVRRFGSSTELLRTHIRNKHQ